MSSSSESDEIRCIERLLPYCLGSKVDAQALQSLREARDLAAASHGASADVLRSVNDRVIEVMAQVVEQS
ncbi:MAG: hypothetical protein ACKO0W_08530, partial [Planctomycetota bacterium]